MAYNLERGEQAYVPVLALSIDGSNVGVKHGYSYLYTVVMLDGHFAHG